MVARPLFIAPTNRARAEHIAALASLDDAALADAINFLDASDPTSSNLDDARAEQRRRLAQPDVAPTITRNLPPLAYRPGLLGQLRAQGRLR